jgi:hypothetical protein
MGDAARSGLIRRDLRSLEVAVWSRLLTFKLINTFASRAAGAPPGAFLLGHLGRDLVSNFAQTASAKGVHTRACRGTRGGCSCRKQISSGNTLERRCFRPATPKPARTSRTCWSLPGFGRKLPYIVDPDRPVRAIAPCAEAEGAGLRPTRSPFAKRLLIAEVPYGASRIASRGIRLVVTSCFTHRGGVGAHTRPLR